MKSRQRSQQPGKPDLSGPEGTASLQGSPLSVTQSTQVFQGPLPPPEILYRYDQIIPGAADRIIQLAESEIRHRQEQEKAATDANIQAQRRQLEIAEIQVRLVHNSDRLGQSLGFLVSVICLGASLYLGLNGQPWLGGVLAALPLAAIIRALRERVKKA
jgi:uncharacterized membrane protein